MSTVNTEKVGPSAICPKCLTHYRASGNCETPTCNRTRLLPIHSNSGRAGESIDDKYTLLEEIGSAGMGTVYRALQHNMEREVALKLLHPTLSRDVDAVKRFLRESKQASRLNHPHIITLFNFGQSEKNELYLVMELLEGVTLGDLIQQEGQLPVDRAIRITQQICSAVQYAHAAGVIHRDLKPDNLFIVQKAGQPHDFIKVFDFGLAKLTSRQDEETVTATGVVCGTPAYMSPEQAMCKPLNEQSDIYSIGIILYEMLAGVRPFSADSPVELLMAHVNSRPPAIRESDPSILVPTAVETVLMQTLAKDPADRPKSADILRTLLSEALRSHAKSPQSTKLSSVDTMVGVEPKNEPGTNSPYADTMDFMPETVRMASPIKTLRFSLLNLCLALLIGAGAYFIYASWNPSSIDDTTDTHEKNSQDRNQAPASPVPQETQSPTQEPTPAVQQPQITTPTVIMIEILTDPPGVTIRREGTLIGTTPLSTARPTGTEKATLLLSKPGYQDKEETLSEHTPKQITFELKERVRKGSKRKKKPTDSPKFRPVVR